MCGAKLEKGHLVLSRRQGDEIRIGDDITIKISNVERGSVKLLVMAPKTVAVHRKEVYEKMGNVPNSRTK